MKSSKIIFVVSAILVVLIAGFLVYRKFVYLPGLAVKLEKQCIQAGGTVKEILCCASVDFGSPEQTLFPNLCGIGPCGCSAEYAKPTKSCDCEEGKCFDGKTCANLPN